jgi:hypothetical protein
MFDTMGPKHHFKAEHIETPSPSTLLPHPGMLSRLSVQWPNNRASSILSHIVNLTAYYSLRIFKRPRPEDLRQWLMIYCNLKTMSTYKPQLFNGKITLFRSSYSNKDDPFYGWREIAKEGVDIIQIPAHHGRFVESPELGRELNSYLVRTQKIPHYFELAS